MIKMTIKTRKTATEIGKLTQFRKNRQPTKMVRSEAQKKRQKMKKIVRLILKSKPSDKAMEELTKIDPMITKKMSYAVIATNRCVKSVIEKGNVKDFLVLLKMAGLYVEEKLIINDDEEDKETFTQVEYKEL